MRNLNSIEAGATGEVWAAPCFLHAIHGEVTTGGKLTLTDGATGAVKLTLTIGADPFIDFTPFGVVRFRETCYATFGGGLAGNLTFTFA